MGLNLFEHKPNPNRTGNYIIWTRTVPTLVACRSCANLLRNWWRSLYQLWIPVVINMGAAHPSQSAISSQKIQMNSCRLLPQKGSGLGSKLLWKLWYVVKANDTSTKILNILIQIFKRDGRSCLLTGVSFNTEDGVDPILAHIIPNSVHNKVSATNIRWHSLIFLLLHSLILSSVLLCSLGQPSVTLFCDSRMT